MSQNKFTAKKLAFAGVALALAYALSFITLFHMPTGGSVTLISMFFVAIIGYWYGPVVGLTAGFAYAFLQFLQNRDYILSVWQVLFDYFFAFGALGLSGFFYKQKHGLITGYLVGVLGRFVFTTLASILFWSEYLELPASIGNKTLATIVAALIYNASYILVEAAITIAIIVIPVVYKALQKSRSYARDEVKK